MELRSNQTSLNSDGDLVVKGYVNKPGQLSQVLSSGVKKFREKVAPGAFSKAIENRTKDIDFLGEHDNKQVLASTKNESLTLLEDGDGLYMEARISPTTYGRDYYQLIKDGLIQSMSFGFRSLRDSWEHVNGMAIRTVHELELYEVSAVKEPAYTQSAIAARGINLIEEIEVPDENTKHSKKEEKDMIKMTNEKENRGMKEFEDIMRGNVEKRNLQMTTNGSSLIPQNVANEIVKKMVEVSPIFAKAKKLSPEAGSIKVSREDDKVVAAFLGEGDSILESALQFKFVELKQKRVGAAVSLSKQFINDAGIDIADYTKDLLARRTAKAVEKSMLVGVGENEFQGVINDADIITVSNATAGNVTMDDLLSLYLSINPEFLSDSMFIIQRKFFNKIAKLKDGFGHYYFQHAVVNGKIQYRLFDVEVHITEALPDDTPVIFGNITEAVSMLIKKEQGIMEITQDTTQALRGSALYVYDFFADSAVTNPQAVAKLKVS